MQIPMLVFAAARQSLGKSQLLVTLAPGSSVRDLRSEVLRLHPELEGLLKFSRFAIQTEYVTEDTELRDGVEIAWIPPVSGG